MVKQCVLKVPEIRMKYEVRRVQTQKMTEEELDKKKADKISDGEKKISKEELRRIWMIVENKMVVQMEEKLEQLAFKKTYVQGREQIQAYTEARYTVFEYWNENSSDQVSGEDSDSDNDEEQKVKKARIANIEALKKGKSVVERPSREW